MNVTSIAAGEGLQRRVAEIRRNDPHAPLYHFIAPQTDNICFDPNGALFWKGRYHLFYLFQDPARKTGTAFPQAGHCWGHASSADLVHWTYHPTALAANPGEPESAIFSGCAMIDRDGVPTLVYHGYGAGTCIATALDDDLIAWGKSPRNPVIPEPKRPGDPGWGVYNVFDPHVWMEGDTYYALLGGQMKPHDRHDTAYLFRSHDLVHWEYRHLFYAPNPSWTSAGDDCACPDFFALGEKYVLSCISHAKGARCYIGSYRDESFQPEQHVPMNWPGGACFAPESLIDGRGRRILWAWALDQRIDWWRTGTIGVMTLPRVLALNPDGELQIEPASELERLRGEPRTLNNLRLPAGRELPIPGISGDCLEMELEVEPDGGGRFVVMLRASPDGEEQTSVEYDAVDGVLRIDVSRSGTPAHGFRPYPLDFWRDGASPVNQTAQVAPCPLQAGERLQLRIFLDRSILEVFCNRRRCLTQRIYPTRADSVGIRIFAGGAPATIHSLTAWKMA